MPAGNWIMYDNAKLLFVNGGIDFDTDAIRMALVLSGYTPDLAHDDWADISPYEHANANGYTAGGATITGTATKTAGTTILSATANTAWTASGGSITARYAVLRKVGTVGSLVDPPIGYALLDTAPADVSAAMGGTLTVQRPASGFFRLTGATG